MEVNNIEFITAGVAEKKYNIPVGSIRRDIYRDGKRSTKLFKEHEIIKLGRDWAISLEAFKRLYVNKIKKNETS